MLSLILSKLESLKAELDLVDPAHETDASETIASLAAALRDGVADEGAGLEPAGQLARTMMEFRTVA